MAKSEVQKKVNDMQTKLQETRGSVRRNRGPVDDAVLVILPMMEDLLGIMSDIVKELPND